MSHLPSGYEWAKGGLLQEDVGPMPGPQGGCCQSPCARRRPHPQAGRRPSLRSGHGWFPGSLAPQVLLHPAASLVGMRFDFKCNCAPPSVLSQLLLSPWTRGIFCLVGPHILLSAVVQLIAILVFSQKMSTRPSSPHYLILFQETVKRCKRSAIR